MYNADKLSDLTEKLEEWNKKYDPKIDYSEFTGFPIDVYLDIDKYDLFIDKLVD